MPPAKGREVVRRASRLGAIRSAAAAGTTPASACAAASARSTSSQACNERAGVEQRPHLRRAVEVPQHLAVERRRHAADTIPTPLRAAPRSTPCPSHVAETPEAGVGYGGAVQATTAIGVRRPREDSAPKVPRAVRYAAELPQRGRPSRRASCSPRRLTLASARSTRGGARRTRRRRRADRGRSADRRPRRDAHGEPLAREEIVFAGQPVALVVAENGGRRRGRGRRRRRRYRAAAARRRPRGRDGAGSAAGAAARRAGARTPGSASSHAAVGGRPRSRTTRSSPRTSSAAAYRRRGCRRRTGRSDAVVAGRFEHQLDPSGATSSRQAATALVEPDGDLVVSKPRRARSRPAPRPGQAVRAARRQGARRADAARRRFRRQARGRSSRSPCGGRARAAPARARGVHAQRGLRGVQPGTRPASSSSRHRRRGRSGDADRLEARIAFERGAARASTASRASPRPLIGGVYRWQAHDVRAYGVETNRVGFGAYRAPGRRPPRFALETLLDELAGRAGDRPARAAPRQLAARGRSRGWTASPMPGFGARRVPRARCATTSCGRAASELPAGEGVGLAVGWWPGASGTAGGDLPAR